MTAQRICVALLGFSDFERRAHLCTFRLGERENSERPSRTRHSLIPVGQRRPNPNLIYCSRLEEGGHLAELDH